MKIVAFRALALTLLMPKTTSGLGFFRGIITFAKISGIYFLALFTSIGVYCLHFHHLGSIPGPHLAEVTKFYYQWLNKDLKLHEEVFQLHEKYGDFVRVGRMPLSNPDPHKAMKRELMCYLRTECGFDCQLGYFAEGFMGRDLFVLSSALASITRLLCAENSTWMASLTTHSIVNGKKFGPRH